LLEVRDFFTAGVTGVLGDLMIGRFGSLLLVGGTELGDVDAIGVATADREGKVLARGRELRLR
jgi:hypothetical protein